MLSKIRFKPPINTLPVSESKAKIRLEFVEICVFKGKLKYLFDWRPRCDDFARRFRIITNYIYRHNRMWV